MPRLLWLRHTLLLFLAVGAIGAIGTAADPAPTPTGFPRFKMQEIETGLKIGYAVIVEDLNRDAKPDIVVVDQHRVVWYENPTWKRRTILEGKTKPDNVCIAAADLDGDGTPELVVGAGWKPFDTQNPGTLQLLKHGKNLDDEWTMHPIPCDEPTVHRIRFADLDGDKKPELILAPLMGRDATAKGNWLDGRPVRILAYTVPKNADLVGWKMRVLNEELHAVHNLTTGTPATEPGLIRPYVLVASYEGLTSIDPTTTPTIAKRVGLGNQAKPQASRGSSEVASGRGATATIEPWHGNEVVTYEFKELGKPYDRLVIDDHLRWGHAVKTADLTGNGWDEIIVGVRDDPNPKLGDTFTERRGVRIYRNTAKDPAREQKWDRLMLDPGGVAVEDLAVADLNNDGKPDLIAVGRATGNCRIYWTQGR